MLEAEHSELEGKCKECTTNEAAAFLKEEESAY